VITSFVDHDSMISSRKIIIDTDRGQDDAFALLLAVGSPRELEINGVTAVAGNVPLARTAANAQMVLELAGRPDIAVYPGCSRPMVRPLFTAEYVHGESGLAPEGRLSPTAWTRSSLQRGSPRNPHFAGRVEWLRR
jgi:inosine-uridine nucleoside N-ribohydrolase